MNRNVALTLAYTFLFELSPRSLLTRGTFSAYELQIFGKGAEDKVGGAAAAFGMTMLVAAVPASYVADKHGRQRTLAFSAFFFLPAVALTVLCTLVLRQRLSKPAFFAALCAEQVLWGSFAGLASPPLEALFADSVPTGTRSRVNQQRVACRFLGQAAGPVIAVVLFAIRGDKWTTPELEFLQLAGSAAAVFTTACLLCFRDRRALGLASEGLLAADAANVPLPPVLADAPQRDDDDAAAAAGSGATTSCPPLMASAPPTAAGSSDGGAASAAAAYNAHDDAFVTEGRQARCLCLTMHYVAPLVGLSDVIMMIGSGMTIQFFELFFWQVVDLSPIGVYATAAAAFTLVCVAALVAQRLSLALGRVTTVLLCNAGGVSLLCAIALHRELLPTAPHAVLIALYILRTMLMNCTGGLMAAVLNDYVPKASRARWNTLDSFKRASWSGSAYLGGWLITRLGYERTFLVTAATQAVGTLMLTPLLYLVPAERDRRGGGGATRAGTRADVTRAPPDEVYCTRAAGGALVVDAHGCTNAQPSSASSSGAK